MTKVYEQFEAAFSNVSAFVIMNGAEQVARVVFKFPKDGAGRLYAYVHYQGFEMSRGYAGGCGYDKKSAAVENAVDKMVSDIADYGHNGGKPNVRNFVTAIQNMGGANWDHALRDAGFTVIQAV